MKLLNKNKGSYLIYISLILLLILALITLYLVFPKTLNEIVFLQKQINGYLASSLRNINQNPQKYGWILLALSFCYGFLHALGPGHGKFIITSFLALHKTKLKETLVLSFCASMAQGLVAIILTTVVIAILRLSSSMFKQSQLWLERISFALVLLLGCYLLWQSLRRLYKLYQQQKVQKFTSFRKFNQIGGSKIMLQPKLEADECGCGHKHVVSLKSNHKLNLKTKIMLILSVGMRPCSGAILVLFLAYMLNLYIWGVFAALLMAFGTGLTLMLFGLVVYYLRTFFAENSKIFSHKYQNHLNYALAGAKLVLAIVIISFATGYLYILAQPKSGIFL